MAYFHLSVRNIPPSAGKRVNAITVRLCITNCTGAVFFTDILLQAGTVATGWVGHVCEIPWTLQG